MEMVKQMTLHGLDAVQAAATHRVTVPGARKWLGRYLADGEAVLADASFRPRCAFLYLHRSEQGVASPGAAQAANAPGSHGVQHGRLGTRRQPRPRTSWPIRVK